MPTGGRGPFSSGSKRPAAQPNNRVHHTRPRFGPATPRRGAPVDPLPGHRPSYSLPVRPGPGLEQPPRPLGKPGAGPAIGPSPAGWRSTFVSSVRLPGAPQTCLLAVIPLTSSNHGINLRYQKRFAKKIDKPFVFPLVQGS